MPDQITADGSDFLQVDRTKLKRGLRRLDAFFVLLCSLVGLDTIGSLAAAGHEAFTWLLILSVAFFIPYGLIVAELSATFPLEGGLYTWLRLAFGKPLAGVVQAVYWLSNPVWVGGTLCVVAMETFGKFVHPLPGFWSYVAGLVFIWAGVLSTSAPVRLGRWVPVVGAWARIVLLGFFFVSTVVYGVSRGTQPLHGADFAPTYVGFIALVPVIVFTFVGFEVSSSAAEEMEQPQRTIPLGVLRSGVLSFVMVAAPIAGILLVLPGDQVTGLGGFIDAAKAVFTVYGGEVLPDGTVELTGFGAVVGVISAVGLIVALFTSGVSWAMGECRAQATACADGTGPRFFGVISAKHGTPVRINMLSGVLATGVMVAAFNFTNGDTGKYFSAGLNLAISLTMLAYLFLFLCLPVLRRKFPHAPRPFRIPGGRLGVWAASIPTTAIVAYTLLQLIWPGLGLGWFGTGDQSDDALPSGFADQRWPYTLAQVVPLAALLLIGVAFVALGRRQTRGAVPARTRSEGTEPVGSRTSSE
ncbi:APC family permease [Amycolatopsis taiwanensis]|uniref:Amino acid permease n=1 Tax=Amycolatopsis taiwanensis TaxID=342230 RepID=A0A9W6R6D2_9PSEU|nr:APC family permease [Amycolatopsis taiwanensis]GLY69553.1 putative amino acid permease [Amycolatopsis taiwanensis]